MTLNALVRLVDPIAIVFRHPDVPVLALDNVPLALARQKNQQ
jgi:hypothetical protein